MKNWRARLPIGAALLLAVFGVTYVDAASSVPRIGPTLCALLGLGALLEFLKMTGVPARTAGGACAVGAAVAVAVAAAVGGSHPAAAALASPVGALCAAWAAVLVAAVVAVLSRRNAPVVPDDLRNAALPAFGLLITVAPLAALGGVATFGGSKGPWILMATVLLVKLNDIGGYLFGSLVGGPKLCPGVSPGKTVAGAVGGLALGLLGGWLAFSFLPTLGGTFTNTQVFAYAALVSAGGQLGDLCESLVKRACGVKDSAALLPAFGGVFDLVDSFILAGPVGYTLLRSWAA